MRTLVCLIFASGVAGSNNFYINRAVLLVLANVAAPASQSAPSS
jgi:hypothetical protein